MKLSLCLVGCLTSCLRGSPQRDMTCVPLLSKELSWHHALYVPICRRSSRHSEGEGSIFYPVSCQLCPQNVRVEIARSLPGLSEIHLSEESTRFARQDLRHIYLVHFIS